jgi:hypothetical protein
MLDFEEKAMCRKVGGVLELSAIKGYEPIAFTKLWLRSKTADNLYHWDFHDVAQSKQYLFHSIELEYDLKPEDARAGDTKMPEVMYWGGYTFTYLSYREHMRPEEVLKVYDVERVLKCYDTLHTLSTGVAVEEMKEQFVNDV